MRDPGQKRALNFLASVGEDGRVARLEEWNDLGLYLREPRARRAPTLLLALRSGQSYMSVGILASIGRKVLFSLGRSSQTEELWPLAHCLLDQSNSSTNGEDTMRRVSEVVFLGALLVLTQACATASVKVAQPAPMALPRYERVAIPAFTERVPMGLPATADIAGAVITTLQEEHPNAFLSVTPKTSEQPGELLVRGTVVSYDPGSRAARAMLIGLGAGDLVLDVELVDAEKNLTIEQFSTSGAIIAGGLVGAMMDEIADRIAKYGAGGGRSEGW
jgi:hypothetical protein